MLVIDQSSSQVVAVIQSLWSKGKLSLRTVIVDGKKYVGSTIVVNRYFVIKVTVNGQTTNCNWCMQSWWCMVIIVQYIL